MKKIILILLLNFSLTACIPIPNTNKPLSGSPASAPDYVLPFKPDTETSNIYFVQPYFFLDLVIPGLGATSDGVSFGGSDIYLQQGNQSIYIGTPYSWNTTYCIRITPGTYTLSIASRSVSPQFKNIQRKISVLPNKTYIYALNTDLKTGGSDKTIVTLTSMPLDEGKYYVKKTPPANCPTLTQFAAQNKSNWNIKITNHTNQILYESFLGDTMPERKIIDANNSITFNKQINRENATKYNLDISNSEDRTYRGGVVTYRYWFNYQSSQLGLTYGGHDDSPFLMVPVCKHSPAVYGSNAKINCEINIWLKT